MDHRESLIRHLMETVRCSVCSASYQQNDVNVLGHQDELWFLTVTCPDCRTQGLIAALVRGEAAAAASQAEPETPRAAEPVRPSRAAMTAPITEDDVADMHDFLTGYRGDLASLVTAR